MEVSSVATLVADEVWVAAATLHRDHPEASDFAVRELLERARELGFTRPGLHAHIVSHCVANRPPSPNRYRMLFETEPGRRRLYRPGDVCDPARAGGKTQPGAAALPAVWHGLLDWYRDWSAQPRPRSADPLLAILGSGRDLWADEAPDDYIARLRRDWA